MCVRVCVGGKGVVLQYHCKSTQDQTIVSGQMTGMIIISHLP